MRHKREYDKAYESTPERIKYRVDLNRERRRRDYGQPTTWTSATPKVAN